jgi:hypothetical protein
VAPYVGGRVGTRPPPNTAGGWRICDAYGIQVSLATLKGGHWAAAHDTFVDCLEHLAKEAGCHTAREIFNAFATAPGLGNAARTWANDDEHGQRKRSGAVPDMILRIPEGGGVPGPERLYEFKFMRHVAQHYDRVNDTTPCRAVTRHAEGFDAMYRRKVRATLDSRFDETGAYTAEGGKGPAEQRLDQFGRVRGLVVGCFGEFSPDLDALVTQLAEAAAQRHWRGMLCANALAAKSAILSYYRAALFFQGVRENAYLIHRRLMRDVSGGAGQGWSQPPPYSGYHQHRLNQFKAAVGSGAFLGHSARRHAGFGG